MIRCCIFPFESLRLSALFLKCFTKFHDFSLMLRASISHRKAHITRANYYQVIQNDLVNSFSFKNIRKRFYQEGGGGAVPPPPGNMVFFWFDKKIEEKRINQVTQPGNILSW